MWKLSENSWKLYLVECVFLSQWMVLYIWHLEVSGELHVNAKMCRDSSGMGVLNEMHLLASYVKWDVEIGRMKAGSGEGMRGEADCLARGCIVETFSAKRERVRKGR